MSISMNHFLGSEGVRIFRRDGPNMVLVTEVCQAMHASTACTPCSGSEFNEQEGQKACQRCQSGTYRSRSKCEPCPEGVVCVGGEWQVLPGFFTLRDNATGELSSTACDLARCTGDRKCGANRKFGEVYWNMVVAMAFQSSTSKLPLLKSALVACQLISPKLKVQDGIARLLTKTDLATFLRKYKALSVRACEELILA